MATITATRPEEATATWNKVFPPEQVTHQQSALFVKKLLAVAVSNITYLRAIFPEDAYGDRCLEDLNLKILRDGSNCPGACQVIKWMKGCFDALDKKYLRMMIIGIYTDSNNPDNVIESYTFKFSYSENGGIDIYRNQQKLAGATNAAETKKATIRLLRSIVVLTQTLQSLPENVVMTMKLLYYDEVTPEDYEPPGFKHCDVDTFHFEDEPMNIKVGDVSTSFHSVKVLVKTSAKQFEMEKHQMPTESQQTNTELSQDENSQVYDSHGDVSPAAPVTVLENRGTDVQVVPEPRLGDSVPSLTPLQAAIPNEQAISTTGSQASSVVQTEEQGVRCACGVHEDDGLMVLCGACQRWQHGVCYLILSEDQAPERHICELCAQAGEPQMEATDPTLCGLSELAKEAMCLWRRALAACKESTMSKVVPVTLARRLGTEVTVATGLINRMEKEKFFKPPARGKKVGNIVNKEKLEAGIKKYLRKLPPKVVETKNSNELKEKEDQHMEVESLASQASDLNISAHWQKKDKQQKKGALNSSQGKGRKRTKTIQGEKFELSDSQDFADTGTKKRRRASIATKPIDSVYCPQ